MSKAKKLPDWLWVRKETDPNDHTVTYLVAQDTMQAHADLDEDRIVGLYKLTGMRRVQTHIEEREC